MEHCLGSNVQTLANYTIKPMVRAEFLYFFFFFVGMNFAKKIGLVSPDLMAKHTHAAVR